MNIAKRQGLSAVPAARLFIDAAENKFIRFLNITNNILNSNSNLKRLDKLTSALFGLAQSQGFFGALNYLFIVSNIAQTYGGIIAGIAFKDSKKKHEQDSISGEQVSDRLQSSIDELNDRMASATDFITKIAYCRYAVNARVGGNNKLKKIINDVCSRHLKELENYVIS